jgi:DNA replication protein DnaC
MKVDLSHIGTVCCDGTGWYKKPVAFGHPDFGKLYRCECGRAGNPDARYNELKESLGAYADCSFDTWNAARQINEAVTWGGNTYDANQQSRALNIATKKAKEYADNPDGSLFIFGSFGAGKTHLASAMALHACGQRNIRVKYRDITTLFDKLRSAAGDFAVDEAMQPLIDCDLLVLDDIGAEDVTSFIHGRLFRLIDSRLHKANIITSNVEIEQLTNILGGRIHSRLQMANRIWLPVSDYRKLPRQR